MVHFILPVIFFDVAINTKIEVKYLLLPMICFAACCILTLSSLYVGSKFFNDGRERIIAYAAGSINTSSLGLSLVLLVFDDKYIRIFMLSTIGILLFAYTIGYHTISNNSESLKARMLNILKMPPIYAFLLGLVGNLCNIKLFDGFGYLFSQMRTTYLVLGMMVFGLSLSKVKFDIGGKFIALFILPKILISPLIYLGFIVLDKFVFHIYDNEMHKLFFVISALPPGVDCIIISSLYNQHPEKAAIGVLISTLIATLYIPFFLQLF